MFRRHEDIMNVNGKVNGAELNETNSFRIWKKPVINVPKEQLNAVLF